ncbi:unnamed protein product, partial [Oppiella nova]
MSTLEDKILGEKLHYYCSSSEDEDNEDIDGNEDNNKTKSAADADHVNSNVTADGDRHWNRWGGNSCNTGPKGVIKD